MDGSLSTLEEWFVKEVSWTNTSALVVHVMDDDRVYEGSTRLVRVMFWGVVFLKALGSQVEEPDVANEIWKFEEVADSPLLDSIRQIDNKPWLQQHFGEKYERTTSLRQSVDLHHIVLLADYVNLELVCVKYEVQEV